MMTQEQTDKLRRKLEIILEVSQSRVIADGFGEYIQAVKTLATEALEIMKCPKCGGGKTVKVLGAGGDYEDWPCPTCRPNDFRRCSFAGGGYDSDTAD